MKKFNLSKLIDVCGSYFGGLSKLKGKWRAYSNLRTGKQIKCGDIGYTDEILAVDDCGNPEEAVIRLILEIQNIINKKEAK